MSWAASRALMELRVHMCQSGVGSKGIRFMGEVSNFTTNEALEDVGLVDVTLVVGYAPDNLPRRVEVATPGSVQDA